MVADYYSSDVIGADAANGIGGTLIVYFDDVGALFMQNAGFLPMIAQHVWCADYDGTPSHDVGPSMAPRAGCPYPYPDLFPSFDFSKHVGTGPYIINGCSGTGCTITITLNPNPYYFAGPRWWNGAVGISLNPDIDGDGFVTSNDLNIVSSMYSAGVQDPIFDFDYRMNLVKKTDTFTNTVGTPAIFTVTEAGPHADTTDLDILRRLVSEGALRGLSPGITWPPARSMTYNWPDVNRDNDIDLDDLTGVFFHQFASTATPANQIYDVTYDGTVSLSNLITAFVRQFTRPAGSA